MSFSLPMLLSSLLSLFSGRELLHVRRRGPVRLLPALLPALQELHRTSGGGGGPGPCWLRRRTHVHYLVAPLFSTALFPFCGVPCPEDTCRIITANMSRMVYVTVSPWAWSAALYGESANLKITNTKPYLEIFSKILTISQKQ